MPFEERPRVLPADHVLRWSIYEVRPGEQRARPLRNTDTWDCPKCRHVFRRELCMCPARYEGYATCGEVRRDLACAKCLERIDLLSPRGSRGDELSEPAQRRDVGIRLPGIDA